MRTSGSSIASLAASSSHLDVVGATTALAQHKVRNGTNDGQRPKDGAHSDAGLLAARKAGVGHCRCRRRGRGRRSRGRGLAAGSAGGAVELCARDVEARHLGRELGCFDKSLQSRDDVISDD